MKGLGPANDSSEGAGLSKVVLTGFACSFGSAPCSRSTSVGIKSTAGSQLASLAQGERHLLCEVSSEGHPHVNRGLGLWAPYRSAPCTWMATTATTGHGIPGCVEPKGQLFSAGPLSWEAAGRSGWVAPTTPEGNSPLHHERQVRVSEDNL